MAALGEPPEVVLRLQFEAMPILAEVRIADRDAAARLLSWFESPAFREQLRLLLVFVLGDVEPQERSDRSD